MERHLCKCKSPTLQYDAPTVFNLLLHPQIQPEVRLHAATQSLNGSLHMRKLLIFWWLFALGLLAAGILSIVYPVIIRNGSDIIVKMVLSERSRNSRFSSFCREMNRQMTRASFHYECSLLTLGLPLTKSEWLWVSLCWQASFWPWLPLQDQCARHISS